jgi:hypothetical protein
MAFFLRGKIFIFFMSGQAFPNAHAINLPDRRVKASGATTASTLAYVMNYAAVGLDVFIRAS